MKLYYYLHPMVMQAEYHRVKDTQTAELVKLRTDMIAAMKRHRLHELAAPQVGHPIQFVVVELTSGSFVELINPNITRMYGSEDRMIEGCISCPPQGNECYIPRMNTLHVEATRLDGEIESVRYDGLNARRVSHAIDHLSGTFFLHRASIVDRRLVTAQFKEWKEQWKMKNERVYQGK